MDIRDIEKKIIQVLYTNADYNEFFSIKLESIVNNDLELFSEDTRDILKEFQKIGYKATLLDLVSNDLKIDLNELLLMIWSNGNDNDNRIFTPQTEKELGEILEDYLTILIKERESKQRESFWSNSDKEATARKLKEIETKKEKFWIKDQEENLKNAIQEIRDFIEWKDDQRLEQYKTGYRAFDNEAGLEIAPWHLIEIGATTGKGKTNLALNLAINQIAKGLKVSFLALEGTKKELYSRCISKLSKVPYRNRRQEKIKNSENSKHVEEYINIIEKYIDLGKLIIYDNVGENLDDIKEIERTIKKQAIENKTNIFYIDNINLITGGTEKESRKNYIEYTNKLKLLAEKLQVVIILLIQLNDDDNFKAPSLNKIAGAKGISRAADTVILFDRIEENVLDINIAKARNGVLKSEISLAFYPDTTSIEDIEKNKQVIFKEKPF